MDSSYDAYTFDPRRLRPPAPLAFALPPLHDPRGLRPNADVDEDEHDGDAKYADEAGAHTLKADPVRLSEAVREAAKRASARTALVAEAMPRLPPLDETRLGDALDAHAREMERRASLGAARTTHDADIQKSVARLVCQAFANASAPSALPSVGLAVRNAPRRPYLPPDLRRVLGECLRDARTRVSPIRPQAAAFEDKSVADALDRAERYVHYAHMRATGTLPHYAGRVAALRHVATRMVPLEATDAECIRRCAAAYERVRRLDAEALEAVSPHLVDMMVGAAAHAGCAEGTRYPLLAHRLASRASRFDTSVTTEMERTVDEALACVPFARSQQVPRCLSDIQQVASEREQLHVARAYAEAAAYAKRTLGFAVQ